MVSRKLRAADGVSASRLRQIADMRLRVMREPQPG